MECRLESDAANGICGALARPLHFEQAAATAKPSKQLIRTRRLGGGKMHLSCFGQGDISYLRKVWGHVAE
jgi:hypothetical protein